MVLVDSSAWIEAFRPTGDLMAKLAIQALLEEYEAALCSSIRLEVLGGARKEDQQRIDRYFQVLPYFSVQEELWQRAIENAWKPRDHGVTVPWNDVLIATVAQQHDYRIYTYDKHFQLMRRKISIVLYEPGYGGAYDAGNG